MRQGPFRTLKPLILASASPRRQALLSGQGLNITVLPSAIPEPVPEDAELPTTYVIRTAHSKGSAVAKNYPDATIISADTIVVYKQEILGKPKNTDQALSILTKLSGAWHEVITGFCVLKQRENINYFHSVVTRVHMSPQPQHILESYISTKEPMDKAGAYGIQGIGAFLIDEIQGSYTNVVGLPLNQILNILLELKTIGVVNASDLAPTP